MPYEGVVPSENRPPPPRQRLSTGVRGHRATASGSEKDGAFSRLAAAQRGKSWKYALEIDSTVWGLIRVDRQQSSDGMTAARHQNHRRCCCFLVSRWVHRRTHSAFHAVFLEICPQPERAMKKIPDNFDQKLKIRARYASIYLTYAGDLP